MPPDSWPGRLRAAPVTLSLLATCAVVFAWAEHQGSTAELETLLHFGASARTEVWAGQWWRMVTAMFLHMGAWHLGANVVLGLALGPEREGALGPGRFLALYVLSGVAGAAVSLIGQDVVSAGASGALFGIIGSVLWSAWRRAGGRMALWADPRFLLALLWIALWFLIGAFAGFDNYAHAGGLAFGLLFSWATETSVPPRPWRVAVVLSLLAVLLVAATRPLGGLLEGGRGHHSAGRHHRLTASEPRRRAEEGRAHRPGQ